MKGDKEKQPLALYTDEEVASVSPVASNRWMWVRRFILCIILITLFMQSLAPIYLDDSDIFIATDIGLTETKKSHIVLHTGFPPTENVSGLTIFPGKAAATAFSPNPDSANAKQIDMKHAFVDGESWWDRWFPNRHVHLVSVQLPVVPLVKNNNSTGIIEATLSICGSKKQRFGIGRPQVPDMKKCVETAALKSDAEESDDLFSVLEWLPEVTIVLQKSKLYWLVVQTPSEAFKWVNSEGGSNQYGTAFETENGWEFKLDGEPIPSAMVMVEYHHKD
ncbi:hypothetical protein EDC94DRAFT_593159 [Helicostylum pulchrum]|uniref:Uncharacterized protein n=1 Tax=Helicostylum pulchrum TaxID=562976 RepID=A0ABP9XW70_9FUNG|nr:hypothetical protein EDC94DRAFT_593159 [Helicostylum pulchrum]